ncbi:Biotin transporter BioY2 [Brevundimonas sp. NIBR10]|uniref:biotin transporter BioY n=1 Tax=Brevundimonas sp. NIBR10 TaxID=3015997 RepID=UPI0022F1A04C|nr:biotin transporter BioY [Brevundimonas sp. NIBR10]WGM46353.1 Biotin transporter BioY2 [Brevundimonas sp. NIBR10]
MTTSRSFNAPRSVWLMMSGTVGFALLIAVAAQIAIPLYPVPMTMQTWAVLLAGAVLGPRWGVASVVLYLALAMAGLPVLANGAGGMIAATGGSAGYLMGFPAAAFLIGWAREQGGLERPLPGFAILLLAHALILACGTGWLILSIGLDPGRAVQVGATPFLIGALVKAVLVLATLWLLRRLRPRP